MEWLTERKGMEWEQKIGVKEATEERRDKEGAGMEKDYVR